MLDVRSGSVLALPAREQAEQRWQAAVAVLLGPFRFIARVRFGRALHSVEGAGAAEPRLTRAERWKARPAMRQFCSWGSVWACCA